MTDKKFENILIIKPSSLGDVLHAFPAVSLVADNYPDANIDWLINKSFAPLIEFHPNVNEAIIFPRKELGNAVKFPKSFYTLVKRLRGKKYDLIIDFQGLMRSAFFAKAAKSSRVVGFANPKEKLSTRFYNEKISIPDKAVHAVEKNLHLVCSMLGINYKQRSPEMKIIEKYRSSVLEKLTSRGIAEDVPCIGVAPVARWISKSWPPVFFAKTINRLHKAHPEVKFVLIGVPEDKPAADEILQQAAESSTVSLVGDTSITELVELLRYFQLLISNDSGPMHIACALQIPVFGLYGPTDPAKTGPFGDIHHVFQGDLECCSCFKKECPSGKYRCHDAINVDTFADAIMKNI